MTRPRPLTALTMLLLIPAVAWTQPAVRPRVPGESTAEGYTISGRVLDPHGVKTADAILRMWRRAPDEQGSSSVPLPTAADGSFVTKRVPPGTYLLEVVRTPHSATSPATTVGLRVVTVTSLDIRGADVTVRQDVALQGKFRMESDDPAAPWPSIIVVNAYLALPGSSLMNGTVADGATGGRFVLRNAFGPRVIRPGYSPAGGASWWPSRVLLDGNDITNVPTDFGQHPNGQLQVVFTRHPARIGGIVQATDGRPVSGAWVLVCASDPKLREAWTTTSHAVRSDANGRFRIAIVPGSYLVRAYPPNTFASRNMALLRLSDVENGGQALKIGERELKSI